LKNNVISFGAKVVVKWLTIPIIDHGAISRLYPLSTINFLRQPERICSAEKEERKRTRKIIRNGELHQIEILHIFAPNLREIYLFGKNLLFQQNWPI